MSESKGIKENKFSVLLTERPIGIIALFFFIIFSIVYLANGTLIILLFPSFLLILWARSILDKDPNDLIIFAERIVSRDKVIEGEDIDIKIIISNNSSQYTHILELKDPISSELQIIKGSNLFLFSLNPYETITLSYTVRFHFIGIYTFNDLYIRHRDYLGLKISELTLSQIQMPELQKIISVVPKLDKIESLPAIRTDWMKFYGGYFHSKQVGHDTDFQGIRDFQFGDVINRINWKATVRRQKLLSNEYNWDKAINAELILDASITATPVWVHSLRAITSLAEFLLRMRNSVGFSYINEFPGHLDCRIGKRQLIRITNRLLHLKTTIISNENILIDRLTVLTKKLSAKAVIIIVSPFTYLPTMEYAIELRKNGFNVLAIVPMSLEKQLNEILIERPEIGEFPFIHELVKSELMIDRLKIRNNLKNSGIHYIEWNLNVPLGKTVQNVRRV